MHSIFKRMLANNFRWKYLLLLLVMVMLFILRPLFSGSEHAVLLSDLVESLLIIISVATFERSSRKTFTSVVIAIPAFITTWLDWYVASPYIEMVRNCSLAVLLIYVFMLVVDVLIKEVEIDFDHLLAAVSGYFLIGFIFASAYEVIEILYSGSFVFNPAIPGVNKDFLYYSFSTLLTEGFGDILPSTVVSRTFPMLEGITGQFYLAFIVARIVGLHIGKLSRKH